MNWTITKMRKVLMAAMLLCGGATVQAQVQVGGSVFGGGNEANVGGNTSVSINQEGAKIGYINNTPNSAENSGDVYGGGAKADVGSPNSDNTTTVTLLNGTVGGNVFGGGLGDDTHAPKVNGVVTVNVGEKEVDNNTGNITYTGEITLLGSVYGCNNAKGSPQDNVTVNIYKTALRATDSATFVGTEPATLTYAIANVFGGGRKADYAPENGDVNSTKKTKVYVHGCDNTVQNVFGGGDAANAIGVEVVIDGGRFDYVFGGGNGAGSDDPADPNYNPGANIGAGGATLAVHGGKINNLFGGSNEKGEFEGESNVSVDNSSGCIEEIGDFFGGSNKVDLGTVAHPVHINTTISCGTKFNNVYGGCNEAKIINGSVTLNILGGEMKNVFGGSRGVANTTAANINGNVTLNLYGGTIKKAFGGSDQNGNITGKITVNVLDYGHIENEGTNNEIDCALHVNNIYGAGNQTSYHPTNSTLVSPVVNLFHGSVTTYNDNGVTKGGNVFGGGLGDTAVVVAYPVVNVGYNATTMSDTLTHITLSKEGYTMPSSFAVNIANAVYGGGEAAPVTGNTTVLMQNSTTTVGYAYGGGNEAIITGTTTLTMTDGAVNKLFGGGNAAGVTGATTVTVNGGTLNGSTDDTHNGVYGGCNDSGNVGGLATLNINGGSLGTDASHLIYVHGGGYGENTTTSGSVEVNVGNGDATPTIYGDVYGGSALGTVNGTGASYNTTNTTNHTYVNLKKGIINGSLYGGGLGDANHEANVYSPVTVTVTTGTVTGAVYGCNNINGSPKSTVKVDINGTDQPATGYALGKVFGGGNQADYDGIPVVEVHNCDNKIEYVYGGGNSAEVNGTNVTVWGGNTIDNVFGGCYGDNVTTSGTNVTIHGGTINHIYGGNNQSGSITGAINVTVNKATESGHSSCDMVLGEVYGGGNVAESAAGHITIGCTGTGAGEGIDYLYGGANQANITSSIELTIEEGSIAHVFGGNNNSGTISGSITVNINKKASPCVWNIGDVYGGGNKAPYSNVSDYPKVNVKNGTVSGNVFGGGLGAAAVVTGNPQVTVGDLTAGTAAVTGNVYGGGDAAGVTGNPTVTIQKAGTTVGNAFGGGNAAAITGATTLTMTDGVAGNLYGGGNQAGVSSTTTVNVNGGTVSTGVYGGCNTTGTVGGAINVYVNGGTVGTSTSNTAYGVFGGGFGSNTTTGGNVTVTIGDDNNLTPTIYGNIYGGSAEGQVNASTANLTKVWLKKGNIYGDLYGGGFGDNDANALVNGNVQVVVDGGTVSANATNGGRVFGCNNANGAPQGTVAVNVTGGTMQSVMGGGNLAAYSGTPAITISNGTITNQVIGGGNQAGVGGSSISISGGSTIATGTADERGVYGGCNTSGEVGGNIIVSITNGTIGADGTPANVHGGGYGNGTSTTGNVAVTINGANVNIWGDVYGGSAKGHVNDAAADKTDVTLKNGTIHGSLYGGGLGDNTYAATVNGAVQVTVEGGSVTGSVYGCNNANGAPQSTVKVDIYGTATPASGYALGNVFGGGNLAAYTGTPEVTIHNCNNSIEYIYGGGNKASVAATNVTVYGGNTIGEVYAGGNGEGVAADYVMVSGNANAYIRGGKIGKVFGGNNASGTISGAINVEIDKATETGHSSCEMVIDEVYGGGNHAASTAGTVTIGCTGTFTQTHGLHPEYIGSTLEGIGTVYGGANQADVSGNISLTINSGIIRNVFGGNNQSGTVSGNIEVDIDKTGNCDWYVGNVYGGGNQAQYTGSPVVNVYNGTVSGNVYGGGNGDPNDASMVPGMVTGSPVVTIGDVNAAHVAVVGGTVYGGGNAAKVTGNTTVTYNDAHASSQVAMLVGGGNAADVTGTTGVTLTNGKVTGGLYGGCYSKGAVDGNITVSVTGGTIGASGAGKSADVYGGGYGPSTSTTGNVEVNINGVSANVYGDVYGGSAFGTVNTYNASKTTTVNILNGTLHGNVFGGGLGENGNTTKGVVNGAVIVNIGSDVNTGNATLTGCSVYGCNNTGGSPKDNVTVNIYKTARTTAQQTNGTEYAIANVFGGGNKASYQPTGTNNDTTTTVHIYGCDNTIGRVFGGSNAAASGSSTRKVKVATVIDGGRFNEIYGGGNGDPTAADIHGSVDLAIHGGVVNQFFVGSNKQGSVSGASTVAVDKEGSCAFNIVDFFCGGNYANISGDVVTTIACEEGIVFRNLYGGCNMADVSGNVSLTVNGGTYDTIYGGSKGDATKSADIGGNVTLNIYGGTVHDAIFGGSNVNGSIAGNITVTVENQQGTGNCALNVADADVYGAGNLAIYTAPAVTNERPNNPVVNINHATVKNVFGGGKGDDTSDETKGSVTGNPKVNIGDNNDGHTATVTQNVYGGGNAAKVSGSTTVLMQNSNSSANKIFGGGNQAGITGATTVTVNGGTLNGGNDATHNGVYGGCNASGNVGGLATLNINGGTFGTNTTYSKVFVHGGGYGENTTTSGSVEVNVGNGDATPTIYGDVYGGSALGTVNGTGASYNTTNTTNHTYVNLKKGTVNGSLYGGGLGDANNAANVYSPVTVTVTTGKVTGAVYGCNNINGSPKSTVAVTINGTNDEANAIQGVYGGGNLAAYDPTTPYSSGATVYPMVTVNGCSSKIKDVFGGGNAAPVPNSKVVINGGTITRVFAGGNGESGTPAHIGWKNTNATPTSGSYGTGIASAEIKGGTITQVFGGSNANGEIRVSSAVNVDKNTGAEACAMYIGEVYGGGNEAAGKAGTVTIGCTGALVAGENGHAAHPENIGTSLEGIGTVYGGANKAGVSGNINLNIQDGLIYKVFGGNNQTGSISGSITVNIDQKANPCGWYVGNVYGGGNLAPYSKNGSSYPEVNIKNGTVSGNVFGGGYGSLAVVTGNPHVTVGDLTAGTAAVTGNVYGGGDAAGVMGNPVVTIQKSGTTVGNAFGGGNMAAITGATTLTMTGGTVGNLYGGGNQAGVSNTTTVNVSGGAVNNGLYGGCNTSGEVGSNITVGITNGTIGASGTPANVHGGGYGNGTSTKGDVTVTINGDNVNIWGDVYGGSAKGHVNDAAADKTNVTLKKGAIHGNLYGGGLGDNTYAATVNGAVQVTVEGGSVTGSVYGCNNANGAPQSTVKVDIYGTATPASGYALGNVFGGGNQAAYTGAPEVTIHNNNNSIEYVYGGGNAASVKGTKVTVYGGNTIGKVFGGCYGANVTTDGTEVNIHGGKILQVFGGNNQSGSVTGAISVNVNKAGEGNSTPCNMYIGEVYGGGNVAPSAAGSVTIGCTGTLETLGANQHYGVDKEGICYVYGGANEANITSGSITLNINSGIVENVFGGNNTSGEIKNTTTNEAVPIQVNINRTNNSCDWYVGNVYGGGNHAAYIGTPDVNIIAGTVSGNVYGGGNEAGVGGGDVAMTGGAVRGGLYGGCNTNGTVTGDVNVSVTNGTVGTDADHTANVYGGGLGQNTIVKGDVDVTIGGGTLWGDVYGGSAKGKVNYDETNGVVTTGKTTDVTLTAGTIHGSLYGGGHGLESIAANVYGPVTVAVNGGMVDSVFGANNAAGAPQGTVAVNITGSTGAIAKVFGGGNEAAYAGTPAVTVSNGTVANVYGGGNKAGVGGGNVSISGGTVTTGVYGGCNTQGVTGGNIVVNITNGTIGSASDGTVANVHGGGYGAATRTTGDVEVNINGAGVKIYGDVYGGSALGNVNAAGKSTTVNVINGTIYKKNYGSKYYGGNVYGGGLGDGSHPAAVNGAVIVNIGSGTVAAVNPKTSEVTNISGNATIQGDVYGCNNANGSPQDNVTVNIFKTASATAPAYAIANVFGGGNLANYTATGKKATVNIYGCDNSVQRVFGGGNAAAAPQVETVIQGGRFDYVFGGGNGESGTAADITSGGVRLEIHGGAVNHYFGGSNRTGNITGGTTLVVDREGPCSGDLVIDEFFCGGNYADITGNLTTEITCGSSLANVQINNLYGGCNMADVTGNVSLTVRGGKYLNIFGGSKGVEDGNNTTEAADITGTVTLNIYGGTVGYMEGNTEHEGNIFGGSNYNGSIGGKITVNVEDLGGTCALDVSHANVFGGGNIAVYAGQPEVNIKHCTVKNVYGGGNGKAADATQTKGSTGSTTVNIGDGDDNHTVTVTGNVYGGGNAAKVSGSTTVLMQNSNSSVNKIFGGGNQAGITGATTVTVNGGTLNGGTDDTHNGVYGGCNASGNVGGLATLNINGGSLGTDANHLIYVHGGGYGQNTTTSGSVEVNVGNGDATPTIYGDVYGGSALGTVNGTGASYNTTNTTNHTYVNLKKGTVNGSLYGGGLGDANHAANVYSPVTVTVTTGTVTGAVYGCNNINGSPQSTVQVDIDGTSNTGIANVFGGGNLAQYSGSPVVNVKQGTVGNVFGGGKGELATGNSRGVKGKVTGDPQVTIGQATGSNTVNISGDVYGGGDAAHVAGTPVVLVQNSNTTVTGSVYGGGNAADVTGSNVTVNDGTIANVFGGGHGDKNTANKYADVNGDDTLTIGGGIIDKVFGGSNSKGSITGKMGMRINKTGSLMKIKEVYGGGNEADGKAGNIYIGCTGDLVALGANEHYGVDQEGIRYVYGGANQADVSNNIALNINSGIVENVFGGNNTSGTISGSIQVNINKTGDCGWYVGNVYGGGNEAPYSGTPDVNIIAGTVSGNVYGGGNKAGVGGGDVSMTGGAVLLGLYGGCNTSGEVTGAINVNINGGTVGTSTSNTAYGVFGGGFGAGTTTSGNVTVTIGDGTSAPTIYGDVYGGSAEGNVNDDIAEITKVWLKSGTVYGDLYGGGFGDNNSEALVNGSVQVVVDGGKVNALNATRGGRVFGCNNAKGTPKGTVEVSINSTAATTLEGNNKVYALQAVYGGGNLAHYDPTTPGNYPTVTVNGCNTSIKDVFGGGNAAAVPYTNVTIYGGDIYRVFAGGNGESGTAANVGYKNSDDTPTTGSYGAGTTNASIKGGTIVKVFGGSNSKGAVRASGTLDIDKRTSGNDICEMKIEEVYGGGNLAAGAPSTLTIGCTGAKVALGDGEHYGVDKEGIRYVYGGANAAAVIGNIVLNINSGIVENVFGGNNVSGAIDGTIQVNINKTSESNSCGWYVGDVYGGGNQADYNGTPIVQIQNGTVSGNVYGGGNNITTASKGVLGSDVRVSGGQVNGNVYGGCNTKGYVENNSSVDLSGGTVEGSVFGGGKGVNTVVHGKATVHIRGADTQVGADVYGGGDEGQVEGGTEVKVLEN